VFDTPVRDVKTLKITTTIHPGLVGFEGIRIGTAKRGAEDWPGRSPQHSMHRIL
jgi:hypothetical protein